MVEIQVSSNENENENTFWNIIIVIIIIGIIWFVYIKNKEGFLSNSIPKDLKKKSLDLSNKIIQKINKTDSMFNTLKPMLNQTNNYEQIINTPISQYAMAPMNNQISQYAMAPMNNQISQYAMDSMNNQISQYAMDPMNNQISQYAMDPMNNQITHESDSVYDSNTYPDLSLTRPFSDTNLDLQDISQMSISQDTPDVRSLKAMNNVAFNDDKKISCNLLGVDSENMDNYKKKFYSMYAHQIECPAKCGLKANGTSKGCAMGSKCGFCSGSGCGCGCGNVNSDTSIPDTFALNYLALDNANKKSCVTCNFKPNGNSLNREWMEKDNLSYNELSEDVKVADEARLRKMRKSDANVSNYVNWENNVYQNSIGESAPDRINEIRTCQDANGTCSLKNYGSSIATAYDKLTANPAYTSRNDCNPYQLTGILEDSASSDMYATV